MIIIIIEALKGSYFMTLSYHTSEEGVCGFYITTPHQVTNKLTVLDQAWPHLQSFSPHLFDRLHNVRRCFQDAPLVNMSQSVSQNWSQPEFRRLLNKIEENPKQNRSIVRQKWKFSTQHESLSNNQGQWFWKGYGYKIFTLSGVSKESRDIVIFRSFPSYFWSR